MKSPSSHIWMSHVSHEWVVIHVTYGQVMSHMDELCHTWINHAAHEGVMSRINESCRIRIHMNKAGHTWMRHVTHEGVMSHENYPSSYLSSPFVLICLLFTRVSRCVCLFVCVYNYDIREPSNISINGDVRRFTYFLSLKAWLPPLLLRPLQCNKKLNIFLKQSSSSIEP